MRHEGLAHRLGKGCGEGARLARGTCDELGGVRRTPAMTPANEAPPATMLASAVGSTSGIASDGCAAPADIPRLGTMWHAIWMPASLAAGPAAAAGSAGPASAIAKGTSTVADAICAKSLASVEPCIDVARAVDVKESNQRSKADFYFSQI